MSSLRGWAKVDTGSFRFGDSRSKYRAIKGPWRSWLRKNFPSAVSAPFGERHERLWAWFEALRPGHQPKAARVEIWPRGGAKSSTAELGVARVGMKKTRRFALYVSGTQGQANKHVQAIAHRFEVLGVPRAVNRYGNSLGWRIDMLRVANGFNVLALGLDAAARGIKLEDDRPDLIIFDDIDERHDSEATIKKKIETITDSIIPAGSSDVAILFVQNRIHSDSIVSQLADGRADFLLKREVFEEPAVRGLKIERVEDEDGDLVYRVVAGEPTWEGQSIAIVEKQINDWGRSAFLREAQHETDGDDDGLWDRERDIDPFRLPPNDYPTLDRVVVAVDPNASEGNDDAGIMVGGSYTNRRTGKKHAVVLEDVTTAGGPAKWAKASVGAYVRWAADKLVAEKNNGGDMVAITISTVEGAPPVKLIHASRGKQTRAEPVQKLYEDGRVHHAGVFLELEKELCRWTPGDPSPNRLDALVWLVTELLLTTGRKLEEYTSVSYHVL